MGQVTVTFSTIEKVESGSFTLGHGISPSTGSITFIPQTAAIITEGTLEFSDGDTTVSLPDCRLENIHDTSDASGRSWTAAVKDKRWRWQFGYINGHYNQRDTWGYVKLETEKTVEQLATLCFEAMGEPFHVLEGLPAEARPEVRWDYINPAQALQQLCEMYGCRVMINTDGIAHVYKIGVGLDLAEFPYEAVADSYDPPDRPEKIILVGGKNEYQADLTLKAVGLQTDGLVLDLRLDSEEHSEGVNCVWEADLGYGGQYAHLAGDIREVAERSAYKWYQIEDDQSIPGKTGTFDRRELLPVCDRLVEKADYTEDGYVFRRPGKAYVTGFYARPNGLGEYANTSAARRVDVSFSIDANRGIVMFSDWVAYYDEDDPLDPINGFVACSDLELTCSVRMERYTKELAVPDGKAGIVDVIRYDELYLKYKDGVAQNQTIVDTDADRFLAGRLDEFGGDTWRLKEGKEYS